MSILNLLCRSGKSPSQFDIWNKFVIDRLINGLNFRLVSVSKIA